MLTFLHCADLHLDSPFRALSPEQASQRRSEQRMLLSRLAETAQQTEADLLLISGDVFDSGRVYPETLHALYQTLEEIDCPVFISPGNHDPFSPRSPYNRTNWPSHVHIFSSSATEAVKLPQLGCIVYGSAFTSTYRMDSPLEDLHADGSFPVRIGCFHGDLSSFTSRYGPITRDQIADSGLTYLALGHNHSASGLQRAGDTWYAWPGCPEGRGFDETDEKGIYYGRIDNDHVQLEFIPLAYRNYRIHRLDMTGGDPEQRMQELLDRADSRDIVRVELIGSIEEDLAARIPELTAMACSGFYSATVLDKTTLSPSVWNRIQEDSLTGLFLREMDRLIKAAEPGEIARLERAARFGIAALEGKEEPR